MQIIWVGSTNVIGAGLTLKHVDRIAARVMSSLTITFIRHGESLDNLRMVYGGWKDAELSDLGRKQAKALGASFAQSNTKFDAIYASDLLRAYHTACAVQEASPGTPEVVKDTNLRERYWGVAEGHHYGDVRPEGTSLEEMMAQGIYPVLVGREERFPDGESANEVRVRASKAVRQYIAKHLGQGHSSIALASHGLCIGELMSSVVALDPNADQSRDFTGLRNTAWSRLTLSTKVPHEVALNADELPQLNVQVTHVNDTSHLGGLLNEDLAVFDSGVAVKAPAVPVNKGSAAGLATSTNA